MLAPWKKSYDQPRQHIKKQRRYFVNNNSAAELLRKVILELLDLGAALADDHAFRILRSWHLVPSLHGK